MIYMAITKAQQKATAKYIKNNYDEMKIRYPVLKNKKFLLPLLWIVRFFDTIIHNPNNAKGRFNDSKKIMNIDDNMVEVQRISGIKKL